MDALPLMDEPLKMYRKGMTTGSNVFNRNLVADHVRFEGQIDDMRQQILYDPPDQRWPVGRFAGRTSAGADPCS
jgi:hypothetical protein